ncbi:PadR family transcriptional regulator [candidate division KSB1 bacterium]
MNLITRLEEVILVAIWKLKENAYGVTINEEVSTLTNKEYSMGALYFTLDQLHKKGYVNKYVSPPVNERRGRSRIYYTLNEEGKKALNVARELQEKLWENLSKFGLSSEV